MAVREPATRTRSGGRRVTVPKTPAERIAAFRQIVEEKAFAKIDGTMVDLFSANYVVQVYDALSPEARERFAAFPAAKMTAIAFAITK